MGNYVLRRLLLLLPAWLFMSVLIFLMIRAIPGDPTAMMLGVDATPEAIAQARERLGLDRPLSVQYFLWLGRAVRGDLGDSYFLGQPVLAAMLSRLPVTLSLTLWGFAIAVGIGIPAGILAATRRNSPVDVTVMGLALLGLSIPDFAMGLILVFVFAVSLGWFPTGGFAPLAAGVLAWSRHMLLPGFSLGFIQAALVARMTRSSMLEVMGMDFVRTARAKGLAERVVTLRHTFRPALLPVLTVMGTAATLMLGGAFITETIFNLPGIGNLVVMAVKRRDYPVIQAGLLFVSTVVILMNLAVDLTYAAVDPRIRYE